MKIPYPKFDELAPKLPADLSKIKHPQYGRVLEDLDEGKVFCHPRGITITQAFAQEFSTTFMEANPLYLNREYALAHGFKDIVVSPRMVMNLVLSLGVQNDSEKAIANLGYYNVCFVRAVYPGDTLRALTKVLKREAKEGKPGIVTIRTIGLNQRDELVIQYDRKIMVAEGGKKSEPSTLTGQPFPDMAEPVMHLPDYPKSFPKNLTGLHTYFENFKVGDIIVHANGRTITDEHIPWTYRLMNTHPLHYDRLYSKARSGPMSGEPIVYGGLVFAWLWGLASRDTTENGIADFGYTQGYHTQPAYSGDTIYAISRVLAKEDLPSPLRGEGQGEGGRVITRPLTPARQGRGDESIHAGIVTFQLIGIKNIRPDAALGKFGADLFVKENDKKAMGKEKIPEKIFEIERRVLIKKA